MALKAIFVVLLSRVVPSAQGSRFTQGLGEAILGGTVEVPTLSGKIEVKIPKGVQPGQHLVLRGKGLPKHGFLVKHGDQYVRFRVKFPTEINEQQNAILEDFVEEEIIHGDGTSNSNKRDWFQRILERVSEPRFMLQLSIFVLILLLLNKSMGSMLAPGNFDRDT